MRLQQRVPPHLYFVVSAVFHYLGPAFAVLLFARVDVLGVAWLRIASAALVFAVWRRPWRAFGRLPRDGRRLLVEWGAVLAVMNACFYLAIDRLPLGTVAAIEFLPVIALAALGVRSQRNVVALSHGVAGVYCSPASTSRASRSAWRSRSRTRCCSPRYIVLAHRVARHPALTGIDGLAASMLIAAVVVTPIGGWQVLPGAERPGRAARRAGVGICSSVIPYVSDQLAMRRLPRATYALMVSLLPATATVIGIVVLTQIPSARELTGVALVIAGVAIHREPPEPRPRSAPAEPAGRSGRASARA